jgi:hypothetical protein
MEETIQAITTTTTVFSATQIHQTGVDCRHFWIPTYFIRVNSSSSREWMEAVVFIATTIELVFRVDRQVALEIVLVSKE